MSIIIIIMFYYLNILANQILEKVTHSADRNTLNLKLVKTNIVQLYF